MEEKPRFEIIDRASINFVCPCGEDWTLEVPNAMQCTSCGRKYHAFIDFDIGFEV